MFAWMQRGKSCTLWDLREKHSYTKMNFPRLLMSVSKGGWWKCEQQQQQQICFFTGVEHQHWDGILDKNSNTSDNISFTTARWKATQSTCFIFQQPEDIWEKSEVWFQLDVLHIFCSSWAGFSLSAKCRGPNIFSRRSPESQNSVKTAVTHQLF